MMKLIAIPTREGCGCKSNIASVMQEMGITLMLAGNMGMGAYNKLSAHGIAVIRGCQGKVDDVLNAYLNGELKDSLESCDHHDCDHHQEKLCANRAPSSSLEMAEVQPKVFKPVYFVPSFGK